MTYQKLLKNIMIVSLLLAVILIVLGFINYQSHWIAGLTFSICGWSQLIIMGFVPIRTRGKENDEKEMAEIYIEHNWLMIAIGLSGVCSYLAPFISTGNETSSYLAFAVAVLSMAVGSFGMYKTCRMTGAELVV